jgi:polyisoprenoid-binding protein YceI
MKKNVLAVIALAALSFTACKKNETAVTGEQQEVTAPSAEATTYNVDAANSLINWEGGKVTGDKHLGTIAVKAGTISVAEGKVTNGTFEIDMNSINVTDITDAEKKAMLEGHLKGATAENADHFFNVSKYPTAKFEITSVTEENGVAMVEGNLTIKEVTKSIKFPATITVADADVTLAAEEFTINRTDFGVNFNSGKFAQDLGDNVINDDIKIKLSVKAVK